MAFLPHPDNMNADVIQVAETKVSKATMHPFAMAVFIKMPDPMICYSVRKSASLYQVMDNMLCRQLYYRRNCIRQRPSGLKSNPIRLPSTSSYFRRVDDPFFDPAIFQLPRWPRRPSYRLCRHRMCAVLSSGGSSGRKIYLAG